MLPQIMVCSFHFFPTPYSNIYIQHSQPVQELIATNHLQCLDANLTYIILSSQFNLIALRVAKAPLSFGYSDGNRVNFTSFVSWLIALALLVSTSTSQHNIIVTELGSIQKCPLPIGRKVNVFSLVYYLHSYTPTAGVLLSSPHMSLSGLCSPVNNNARVCQLIWSMTETLFT